METPIHKNYNQKRLIIGKIYVRQWTNLNVEAVKQIINESFGKELVVKVERFYARYGHLKCTTSLFKLFLDESLWSEATTTTILWNGTTYKIMPYIKEPRGCAKCLAFDHHVTKCTEKFYTCKDCGGKAEKDELLSKLYHQLIFNKHTCKKEIHPCVNCIKMGIFITAHSPFSGECPLKKAELRIETIRRESEGVNTYEKVNETMYYTKKNNKLKIVNVVDETNTKQETQQQKHHGNKSDDYVDETKEKEKEEEEEYVDYFSH